MKINMFVIVAVVTAIVFSVIFGFFVGKNSINNDTVNSPLPFSPSQKACTMEAKICPDGSAVGRTGPDCEFSPCP